MPFLTPMPGNVSMRKFSAVIVSFCLAAVFAKEPLHELVELVTLDPTIKLDIRYATDRNFAGRSVYPEARAFLQCPAAAALLEAHSWLKAQGFGIVVYDAYRPWSVSKLFWELTPPSRRKYVANPSKGSGHNRGCAVDVGLFELRSGRELEMPSSYDEMSGRSSISYAGGTAEQRNHRDLLRRAMERKGHFKVYPPEWWHYTYRNCRKYGILDIPFAAIVPAGGKPCI